MSGPEFPTSADSLEAQAMLTAIEANEEATFTSLAREAEATLERDGDLSRYAKQIDQLKAINASIAIQKEVFAPVLRGDYRAAALAMLVARSTDEDNVVPLASTDEDSVATLAKELEGGAAKTIIQARAMEVTERVNAKKIEFLTALIARGRA